MAVWKAISLFWVIECLRFRQWLWNRDWRRRWRFYRARTLAWIETRNFIWLYQQVRAWQCVLSSHPSWSASLLNTHLGEVGCSPVVVVYQSAELAQVHLRALRGCQAIQFVVPVLQLLVVGLWVVGWLSASAGDLEGGGSDESSHSFQYQPISMNINSDYLLLIGWKIVVIILVAWTKITPAPPGWSSADPDSPYLSVLLHSGEASLSSVCPFFLVSQ